jgi:hypothetical protein
MPSLAKSGPGSWAHPKLAGMLIIAKQPQLSRAPFKLLFLIGLSIT